jgi:hypothetical protein
MRHRPLTLLALVAALVLAAATRQAPLNARAAAIHAATPAADPCAAHAGSPVAATERADFPVLQAHAYRMAGKVRPLLFWISQKNVGSGVIVWRGGDGASAYELLIGTDPAIAPRGVNRWGYIMESVRAGATHVFAVMTTEAESKMSDVGGKAKSGVAAGGRFKAIDARVDAGAVCAATGTFDTERDLALKDVSALVLDVRGRLTNVTPYDGVLAAGTRAGFLTAVAELMKDTMAARGSGGGALARLRGRTIPYVHGRFLLDMALVGAEPAELAGLPGVTAAQAPVHASFEARSRDTGERYRFELDYATTGPLAGVPLVIRYQPRWWLQVELMLEADSTRVASLQRSGALSAAWENATR